MYIYEIDLRSKNDGKKYIGDNKVVYEIKNWTLFNAETGRKIEEDYYLVSVLNMDFKEV